MSRMFGTDGVRGVANDALSCELAMQIGLAGAYVLSKNEKHPRIIIGTDTRKSKDMLKCALEAGICSAGGCVLDAGVIPTPALAYLTRKYNANAAVMISASHNPMQDNGIKWFDNCGYKISNEIEDEIEAVIKQGCVTERPLGGEIGTITELKSAKEDYISFLCSACDGDFSGVHVALDCANGASSEFAPEVFRRLGARVSVTSNEPDGCNINASCGSTHIENLTEFMKDKGADVGFAFDGDADRLIAADENGNEVNGDTIMGICALAMYAQGKLKKDTLVITVMSNLGLKKRMQEAGIKVEETAVGDKYVLQCIRENGYNLGGEQSGHIIFFDHNTSGDGMLSAIMLLDTLMQSGKKLSHLAAGIPILPQHLLNVQVDRALMETAKKDGDMQKRIETVKEQLGDSGRVLVRASGTEPLIRIMLEGADREDIKAKAQYIAEPLLKKYDGVCRNK
ncbi:MAG: phosphoglucosamine mutase [Clostridia bacterium]|nr:phosphoglucosamine mutase [Clostridia bacterium]